MKITLGYRLRLFRERKNWTQRQAADIFGITSAALSNYERDNRAPDIYTLKRIAEIYDTSLDYLLDGKHVPTPAVLSQQSYQDARIKGIIGSDCLRLIYKIGHLNRQEQKLLALLLEGIQSSKEKKAF